MKIDVENKVYFNTKSPKISYEEIVE